MTVAVGPLLSVPENRTVILSRIPMGWLTLKWEFPSKRLRETRQRPPGGGIHGTSQIQICIADYVVDLTWSSLRVLWFPEIPLKVLTILEDCHTRLWARKQGACVVVVVVLARFSQGGNLRNRAGGGEGRRRCAMMMTHAFLLRFRP